MDCLRCSKKMEYLNQYRFESQENKRGLFDALFDIEKHLIFDVHVCPNCKHSEFFYKGAKRKADG